MIYELFTWLLAFFVLAALIVIVVYQVVCLADLETDQINPHDAASCINNVVVPEFITHCTLCCLFLVTGNWFMLLLSLPYLLYNAKMYSDRNHLVDVTELFTHLNREKKKRYIKIGYLLVLFTLSLFWLIWSALGDHDHIHHEYIRHDNIHHDHINQHIHHDHYHHEQMHHI